MTMQYAMATNWDPELPAKLKGSSVSSLYGQIWNDPLGGGRMALFLPRIGREEAARFIAAARENGIAFSYLANGSCLDNSEFSKKGYRRVMEHLEWIAASGADTITVTLPFLLELAKKHFPHLRVSVSSFARVLNPYLARSWEDMGADRIILPEPLGRDFRMLAKIRESVGCELELIANHACLYYCPLDLHHRNMVSHASQRDHLCGGFAVDYCKLTCQRMKLEKPEELIRSRWIRPEDVGQYEKIGIDCLKLVERFRGTESLLRILKAYERRTSPDNLARLLTLPQAGEYLQPNMDTLDRPDLIDPQAMEQVVAVLREPFPDKVYIYNRELAGFLDHFLTHDCSHSDCRECGYCAAVAQRAVRIDPHWRQEMLARFDAAIEILTAGKIAGEPS